MSQCIVTEHEWRDLKGFSDCGLSLSTSSNEAAKMVDALLTQFYRYYEDKSLGGMMGTVKHMREADPDYVLGPLFEIRFMLLRRRLDIFPELQKKLKEMENLANTQTLNEWEKKLVSVMKNFAKGYGLKALRTLEEMVLDNPKDFVSLRMAYNFSLILGDWSGMKSIMPKVVATWTPDMPLYGYVQGMHGFFLNEFKQRKEAEKYTLKALEINPSDCWGTHAHAHILLETNRSDEGIKFMEKNEPKWTTGKMLLQHNYWHWGLFHLDKGDYESVLGVLDDHIIAGCSQGTTFPLTDSSSLLYRLEMEGVPVGKRWKKINPLWNPSQHMWVFEEVHKMMSHVGAKDYESANSLLESCREFVREGEGTNWEVVKDVGLSLIEAMMAFDKAKYDDVVDLLLPIRDDVSRIGGSNAQRDVFNLLLNNSAIQCSSDKYKDLGDKLIQERKQLLGEDGVTSRLEESLLKKHGT